MIKQYCVLRSFGCNLGETRTRYAVLLDEEYEEVLALLTPYRSCTDDELDAKLKKAGICVFGGDLLQKLIDELSDPSFFDHLCNELETLLQEENNAETFAQKVTFMKDNKLYNAAIERTNSLPQGEAKDLFTTACKDLHDIL